MLQAVDLGFAYGTTQVLRHVTCTIPQGGIVGILGPNGSGKTTMLRLLSGGLTPATGRVMLGGRNLRTIPHRDLAKRVAVVPQDTHLTFDYRVLEVALMGRFPHLGPFELEGPDDLAAARRGLEATGTLGLAERPFDTLSGGERQRVVIGSALTQFEGSDLPNPRDAASHIDAKILLLDEPTASLDLHYQIEVGSLLKRLNRDRRLTIVISTHDLNFAAGLCGEVILLQNGAVMASGPTSDVLTREAVQRLYAVQADVRFHEAAGHLTVVPLVGTAGDADREASPPEAPTPHAPARETTTSGPVVVSSSEDWTSAAADPDALPAAARRLRSRLILTWIGFGVLALLTCVAAPLLGSTPVNLLRAFDTSIPFADNVDAQIFLVARLPRTIAGALVGAALAASGVVLQALLRNPLATPFTLGVSAGAALGAMLALTFLPPLLIAGVSGVPFASFTGALGAVGIVYALARVRQSGLSTDVLLLAGVTLNAFFSALILFVQFLADYTQALRTVRWLMGDLDVSSYAPIVAALPLLAVSFFAFLWLMRALNLLALGPEAAMTRGVNVLRTQRLAFISSSVATGAAVSLGGPVGFIGIVVPHLVRLMVGADHRLVLPASAFFGAGFLVACDVVARMALAPLELPVGIVTAIIGGPFFLWLLLRKNR